MKKQLIIVTIILSAFVSYAQKHHSDHPADSVRHEHKRVDSAHHEHKRKNYCPHRFNLYLGASYVNNIYDKIENDLIYSNYSCGSVFEFKYAYFFTRHWGFGLGVALSKFSGKETLNINGAIQNYDDQTYDLTGTGRQYSLHYKGNNLIEKQTVWAVEVPLQLQFEHKGDKWGLFVGLGAKGYFPLAAGSRFPVGAGNIMLTAHDEFMNVTYDDLPGRFGKRDARSLPAKAKMRYSVDLQGDLGTTFALSKKADLYFGVYASYGFLDILPEDGTKIDIITPSESGPFTVNSLLASNYIKLYNNSLQSSGSENVKKVSEKWNMWQVGIKVGIHIKACRKGDPTLRDLKRSYYEEATGTGTVTSSTSENFHFVTKKQYIYTVPVSNEELVQENDMSSKELENIKSLINALSNTKVLFDLDKDIPKITDYNNIAKAVEILNQDNSLTIIVEGYTCDLGSELHNEDLAKRRAHAVRQIFLDREANPAQVQTASYTYSAPESQYNISDPHREGHRAVIFKVVKQ